MSKTTNCKKSKHILVYVFEYRGRRFTNKILLDEDTPGVEMMYDDHDLEVTWLYRLYHAGFEIVVNIVICDNANDNAHNGHVAASAFVNIYRAVPKQDTRNLIASFEPDEWAYIDEQEPKNTICKHTFYDDGTR